jgi:hypothetical protein
MGVRYRPMQPKDVAKCAEIIATHPVISPRYGQAIKYLRPAWLALLGCEATNATVFEKVDGPRTTICFVGISVFVNDAFVRELKGPPLFWFGPELAKRILLGDSPLLSDKQLREANAAYGGLNLLVWEGCARVNFYEDPEVLRSMMDGFIEEHRGYKLKELIGAQLESGERLQWTLNSGGLLWDAEKSCYVKGLNGDAKEIIRKPHIIGLTRDIELGRRPWGASWIGALFDYHPPQIGFTRCEQRLLLAALPGRTDEEISHELSMSRLTAKNVWRSIYNRAAWRLPEFFRGQPETERGKEKRRRLLAYLREHPEELRPVSRKLLKPSH